VSPALVRRTVLPLIAGLVFVGLMFLAVLPTRTYLAQRRDRSAAEAQLQLLSRQNRSLQQRARLLHTDAEIERLARKQYNLVKPGEEAYALLLAPTSSTPSPLSAGLFANFWERRLKP